MKPPPHVCEELLMTMHSSAKPSADWSCVNKLCNPGVCQAMWQGRFCQVTTKKQKHPLPTTRHQIVGAPSFHSVPVTERLWQASVFVLKISLWPRSPALCGCADTQQLDVFKGRQLCGLHQLSASSLEFNMCLIPSSVSLNLRQSSLSMKPFYRSISNTSEEYSPSDSGISAGSSSDCEEFRDRWVADWLCLRHSYRTCWVVCVFLCLLWGELAVVDSWSYISEETKQAVDAIFVSSTCVRFYCSFWIFPWRNLVRARCSPFKIQSIHLHLEIPLSWIL